jgi:Ca2+-binding EF-hand superfamily protein
MQFINIVVHSVENMNFRVHLQYEFSMLDLDSYLTVSAKALAHILNLHLLRHPVQV